jgi:hypothetical protein
MEAIMSEPNWTVRIILTLVVVLVLGAVVAGYVESTKPPRQQHVTQMVPNDRLP